MSGPGRGNWTTKHGGARRSGRAPEYGVWHKMIQRCHNERSPDFHRYGGRGITVSEAWRSYPNFISDMGPRPSPAHTIERLDNDDGYSASNCVWATRDVQARNRRPRQRPLVCHAGHDMAGDNAYLRPDGKRGCRACRRENMRAYHERRKAVRTA